MQAKILIGLIFVFAVIIGQTAANESFQLEEKTNMKIPGCSTGDCLARMVTPECGTIITESIILTEDLDCSGQSYNTAITFGADDIWLYCNGHRITGNGGQAVWARDKSNIHIVDCTFTRFDEAITMAYVQDATIKYNNIFARNEAIDISDTQNVQIKQNRFETDYHDASAVVIIRHSQDTIVEKNEIEESFTGVRVIDSNNTLIDENNFEELETAVYNTRSPSTTIYNNRFDEIKTFTTATYSDDIVIKNNDGYGEGDKWGILLENSDNALIERNEISRFGTAIYLRNVDESRIYRNEVSRSYSAFDITLNSDSNIIHRNQIVDNGFGLIMRMGTHNVFYSNTFYENDVQALQLTSEVNEWDFNGLGNFWSDLFENEGYPESYLIYEYGIDNHPYLVDVDIDANIRQITPQTAYAGDAILFNIRVEMEYEIFEQPLEVGYVLTNGIETMEGVFELELDFEEAEHESYAYLNFPIAGLYNVSLTIDPENKITPFDEDKVSVRTVEVLPKQKTLKNKPRLEVNVQ